MDRRRSRSDEQRTVFNVTLAKAIGLYQVLDPSSARWRGRNAWHALFAVLAAYGCVVSASLLATAWHFWPEHAAKDVMCVLVVQNYAMTCYKTGTLVRHSAALWRCLAAARFDFTATGRRNVPLMRRWRARSVRGTGALCLAACTAAACLMSYPLTLANRLDATSGRGSYRANVFDANYPWSADVYDSWYGAFYAAELFYTAVFLSFFLAYDVALVSLSLAVSCQFDAVSAELRALGHHRGGDPSAEDYSVRKSTTDREDAVLYERLRTILNDHQAIMEKYEEFLSIFRITVLTQILVTASTLIFIWFIVVVDSIESVLNGFQQLKPTSMKMIFGYPAYVLQSFMTCYIFENINNQKDSVIFALYSSNWTEMNMKCKKLILMTMMMNNAHNKKLQFSRQKIFNLEMLYKTFRFCYSVSSMLVNYKLANKK